MHRRAAARTQARSAGRATAAPVTTSPSIPNSLVGRALGNPGRRGRGPRLGELGRQPDPYVRAVVQAALGRDLGDVRLRTGPVQDAALDEAGVDALAHGREIAVRRDHDHPGSRAGRILLIHELVHLLQQRGTDGTGDPAPGTLQEHEAHQISHDLADRPPLPGPLLARPIDGPVSPAPPVASRSTGCP